MKNNLLTTRLLMIYEGMKKKLMEMERQPQPKYECMMCGDNLDILKVLECNTKEANKHYICFNTESDCLNGYVNSELGYNHINICCPHCKVEWDHAQLKGKQDEKHILSDQTIKLLDKKVFDIFLEILRGASIRCPNCNYYEEKDEKNLKATGGMFICAKCQQVTCFECDPPVKLADSLQNYQNNHSEHKKVKNRKK